MLDFLIDNIFVMFLGRVFQQTVGIPMGTNCAPLLADLFLYSYEPYFMQRLKKSPGTVPWPCNDAWLHVLDLGLLTGTVTIKAENDTNPYISDTELLCWILIDSFQSNILLITGIGHWPFYPRWRSRYQVKSAPI